MRVFVLDDEPMRITHFKELHVKDTAVALLHPFSVLEVLNTEEKFDLFRLDFNLETSINGLDIIASLIQLLDKDKYPDEIIVHSLDKENGKAMCRLAKLNGLCNHVYYSPFGR